MSAPSANKIHTLPVLVNYHLPSSSSTFTTLFSSPQQVYIHANASSTKSSDGGNDEVWGSIYLKAVIQGVILSSPELSPFQSDSVDPSIYVLDPRETFLRRQRANNAAPLHLRNSNPSASTLEVGIAGGSEVWAGKGLLTWALNEAGQGKNLITGRVARSPDFAMVAKEGMNPLEALMMSQGEGWGLEVNLSLRTGVQSGGSGGMGVSSSVTQGVMMGRSASNLSVISAAAEPVRRPSTSSKAPVDAEVRKEQSQPKLQPSIVAEKGRPTKALPTRSQSRQSSAAPAPSSSRQPSPAKTMVNTPSNTRDPKPRTTSISTSAKKRKSATPAPPISSALDEVNININTHTVTGRPISRALRDDSNQPPASKPLFPSIPAALYNNPASLTKAQAHRLLASPAFLELLERTAGTSLQSPGAKSDDTLVEEGESGAKRVKHDHASEEGKGELKCWNCGRTKSSVWRSRTMEDGKAVRVCNACGLYWNQRKEMRPPNMWSAVDDEVTERPRVAKRKQTIPPVPAIPRKTLQGNSGNEASSSASSPASAFRRTLSAAAEQDAKRIASLRRPVPPPPSSLQQVRNAPSAPMTSPVQAAKARTRNVTGNAGAAAAGKGEEWKTQRGVTASSPGGWLPKDAAQPASEGFQPMSTIQENSTSSPSSRQFTSSAQIQSLQLAPDHTDFAHFAKTAAAVEGDGWGTDLSTLFDVDAFSEGLDPLPPTPRRSPRKHASSTHAASAAANPHLRRISINNPMSMLTSDTQIRSDSDASTISNLFHSSTGNSPKSTFDFSALPPSSPPVMPDYLNSAMMFSSPDHSPLSMFGPSPVDMPTTTSAGLGAGRTTPEKASGLRNSFTPMERLDSVQSQLTVASSDFQPIPPHTQQAMVAPDHALVPHGDADGMSIEEMTRILNEAGMDQSAWDELFAFTADPSFNTANMNGNTNIGHASHSGGMENPFLVTQAGDQSHSSFNSVMAGGNEQSGETHLEGIMGEQDWSILLNALNGHV